MSESRVLAWLMRGRGIQSRLSSRRCRGCDDQSIHDSHMTRYGLWHLGRMAAKAERRPARIATHEADVQ